MKFKIGESGFYDLKTKKHGKSANLYWETHLFTFLWTWFKNDIWLIKCWVKTFKGLWRRK